MILPKSFFSLVDYFALFISTYSVRLVELGKNGSVKTKASLQSEAPLISGDVVDEALLAQLVTKLRQDSGCSADYAVVCIPEKIAYSREHSLPHVSMPEIQEALGWQIGTIFPFSPDDIYYDWKLVGQTPKETKAVVVAVAKKTVDGVINALSSINIRVISFEPSASVLTRALSGTISGDHTIMEIDSFGTSATLIKNGVALLTTTTHFQADADPQQTFDGIAASVTGMWSHAFGPDIPTDLKVYITGEKATEQIGQLLSQKISHPVALLPFSFVEPAYQIPYAAAVSAVLPPQSEQSVNVLPAPLQAEYQLEVERVQAKKTFLFAFIPAATALVIAISLYGFTWFQTTVIKPPAPPQAATGNAGVNVPLLLQKAQKISRLQSVKSTPVSVIDSLVSVQEPSIQIKQISIDMAKKTVEVSISGANRTAFVNYKTALEASGAVTNVTIPLAALAAELQMDTQITMMMKDQVP